MALKIELTGAPPVLPAWRYLRARPARRLPFASARHQRCSTLSTRLNAQWLTRYPCSGQAAKRDWLWVPDIGSSHHNCRRTAVPVLLRPPPLLPRQVAFPWWTNWSSLWSGASRCASSWATANRTATRRSIASASSWGAWWPPGRRSCIGRPSAGPGMNRATPV